MQAFWYFCRKSGAKPYRICRKSGANYILCAKSILFFILLRSSSSKSLAFSIIRMFFLTEPY